MAFIDTLLDLFVSRLGIILNVSFRDFMKHLEVLRVTYFFFPLSFLTDGLRERGRV